MNLLNKFKRKLKTPTLKMKKNGAGFTLIEAIVVTAVIGIISSMMIVNWRKSERQYQLQRAAQEIVQTIRKAQDYALSGKKMVWPGYPNGIVPRSYGVQFERGNRTYFIYGDQIGNVGYQNPEDLEESYRQLEAGIEIDYLFFNIVDIIFSVPDGYMTFNLNPSITSTTIRIKRTGTTCPSTNCRSIIVNRTGEINIQ